MIELPQMSTLNTTQDINKQLANIRSYLNQLKDNIETELNNVSYDMLSTDLKKRIDKINDEIILAGEDQNNGQLGIDSLIAQYASIGTLIATVGEIQNLTCDSITTNTLKSLVDMEVRQITANNKITSDKIAIVSELTDYPKKRGYINVNTITGNLVSGLTKVSGALGEFETLKITGNSQQGLDATINASTLEPTDGKALSINGGGKGTDHTAGRITIGEGKFGILKIYTGNEYQPVSTQQITLSDGTQVTVLKI